MAPRRRFAAALVVCAALSCALAACADAPPTAPPAWRAAIDAWRPGDPIPDVPLVDQDGRAFTTARFDGVPVVVGFVFTRCAVPTACPATMVKLRAIDDDARARGVDLRFLVVTLDPGHDTPDVLRAYAARHGVDAARWTFATGAPGLVDDALPSLFNVIATGAAPALNHVVKIALLGPDRRPRGEWPDADVPAAVVVDRAKG